MNKEHYQRVMRVIDEVMDCPMSDREATLARLCSNDSELRREVERLLAQDHVRSGFLEEFPFGAMSMIEMEADSQRIVGKRIGQYKIVSEIGRGGMGVVYLAERDDAEYHTRVAIKLIKRGMDTDALLRRFRHERQILANLNHPNIARLLDGGTTADGLPYFVLEYVEGARITEYAAARNLSTNERLRLFREVCAAVSYAHDNHIIHRDIKPSNIIVTEKGAIKLLDFGVAKFLRGDADELTVDMTATEMRVMTPEYASPEQLRGEAVTTATDIYSLGVMLYELLTGQRPYNFKSRRPDEMARVICEQQPEKPSDAVSRSEAVSRREKASRGETNSQSNGTANNRSRETGDAGGQRTLASKSLRRRLRGDLDNIVLMAMNKEPSRRYALVEDFSDDIRRHLEGLPVRARKQTFPYQSALLLKRNLTQRWRATLVIVLISALVAGTVATLSVYWLNNAPRQTEVAAAHVRSIAVLPFSVEGIESEDGNPYLASGVAETLIARLGRIRGLDVRPLRAVQIYAGGGGQSPSVRGRALGVDSVLAGSIRRQGEMVSVSVRLVKVEGEETLWMREFNGSAQDLGTIQNSIAEGAIAALAPRLTAEERGRVVNRRAIDTQAYDAYMRGRFFWNKRTGEGYERAIEYFNRAIEIDSNYAEAHAGLADAYALLASSDTAILAFARRPERMEMARQAARRALEIDESLAEAHTSLGFIGWHYDWDFTASEREFQRAIELNPSYATAHHWYAYCLLAMERGDEALAEIRRALELDPLSVIINQDVGEILYWLRRYDEAIEQERRALELDPNSARPRSIIIWSYIHKGMFQEAITELQNQGGANNRDPNTLITVAALYLKMGRRDETQRLLNEARRRGARINEANFWSLEHEHVSAISWQGDREAVYRWLAAEYEHRGGGLPHVRVDPRFDWLRSDPRFQDYLRRIVPRQ